MRRGLTTIVVFVFLGEAASAFAQSPRTGTFDVAVGGLWIGGTDVGSGDANETTSSGGSFRLFSSETTLSSAGGVEARVGVKVWSGIEAMAAGSYSTPRLRVAIANDAEGAAPVTAAERIQQYAISGGVLLYLPNGGHDRISPFVEGEGGVSRNVHEDRSLVDSGPLFAVGGGIKIALGSGGGRMKSIGARIDARAVVRSDPTLFDRRHAVPAIGASLYVRF